MESDTVEKSQSANAGKLELQMMQGNVFNKGRDNPAHECSESPMTDTNMDTDKPSRAEENGVSDTEDSCSPIASQPEEQSTPTTESDMQAAASVEESVSNNSPEASEGAPGTSGTTEGACSSEPPINGDRSATENDDDDKMSDVSIDYGELWEDCVEEKYLDPSPHAFYTPFRRYLAKVLSPTARTFLSKHLNQDVEGISSHGYAKDWHGLAECMGRDYENTQSFDRFKDPTGELIKDWQTESGSILGKLLHYLTKLDRYDILHDVTFMDMIHRSVGIYEKEREVIAKEREDRRIELLRKKNPLLAIGDTDDVKAEFDSFICFEEEDSEFVKEMIYECETKAGLKLCLDARDLLAGHNEQYITAEMIKARCFRTIVIISEAFVRKESEMSQFALRVAQSLSPAASRSKMIPVRINECEMPTSLVHITPVDYTRCRERSWLWRKIVATLKSQQDSLSMVEKQKLRHLNYYPKSVPDLRTAMVDESYEPPVFPSYAATRNAKPSKTWGGSRNSSSQSSRASGQGCEGRITDTTNMSKKEKLKQSIRKFFSSKTR